MSLDSTIGGSSAESYVSVADAETYWDNHSSPTEWTDATISEIESALRYATQWLDQNYSWYSTIYATTQSLGWPRASYYDSEGRTIGGTGVIPQKIKDATCEMALQYLKEDFTSTDNENVISESIGSASITYNKSSKNYSFIKIMLKDFGTPSQANNARMYRG